jgi:hypothetical protein
MTRINLVDPAVLHRKHLIAELHELPRIFSLARKAQSNIKNRKIPPDYTLGVGHVIFFYDKLQFLANRYRLLCNEMRKRKYNVNQIAESDLLSGIDKSLINDYIPTKSAIQINIQRIKDRTKAEWN